MPIATGTRLGSHNVLALIGAGGMGEVYRAHDTKLGRDVAIKVLPEQFARDPERLARFQREAKLLAALNHPNIAAIYGLEQSGDTHYLVMELVEGATLAERILNGAIPLDEALPIARQVADAVEYAHDKNVIHRDLKPGNIKVTAEGTVKVLDFGLAKALSDEPTAEDMSNSPTLSMAATRQGVILGTAAYMAPEQARGKTADRRADIWAFGVVLYEMFTGKRAFEGEDVSLILAAVMKSEPDWESLPADLRPAVGVVLRRCLRKDPKQRVQAMGDVRLAMEGAFETPVSQSAEALVASRSAGWKWTTLWTAGGVVAGGLAIGLAAWLLTRPSPQAVMRFPIPLAAGENFSGTGRPIVAISPDGTHIAYSIDEGISLWPLDRLQATPIPGAYGARNPFFSPDGQWVGFWAGGQLKRVSLNGGAPVTLCSATNPYGVSWGADNEILYGQGAEGIWRVPGAGGTPEQVIEVENGEVAHGPQLLPGGDWVLYTLRPSGVGGWDQAQIVVQSLATSERIVLIEGGRDARYLSTGHLVYALNGVLLAVPFDLAARRVTGGPTPLVEGVADAGGLTGAAQFSVAANGSLVYVSGAGRAATFRLTWVNRDGQEEAISTQPQEFRRLRISPNGTRIAVEVEGPDNTDVWIWNLARGGMTRLTFDAAYDGNPMWTPDSSRVVFASGREGYGLYWKAADGTGEVERLMERPVSFAPQAWAADGRLIFEDDLNLNQGDIGVLSLEGDRAAEPLLHTEFAEKNPALSPDGRWLAYDSNESGQDEIYVRPFPDINDGKWQVSAAGGLEPVWSPDGRELFYRGASGLMAVPVQTTPTFTYQTPKSLFSLAPYVFITWGRHYDISPDGRRFVFLKRAPQTGQDAGAPQLTVVLNWFEELKQRVPTGN